MNETFPNFDARTLSEGTYCLHSLVTTYLGKTISEDFCSAWRQNDFMCAVQNYWKLCTKIAFACHWYQWNLSGVLLISLCSLNKLIIELGANKFTYSVSLLGDKIE